MGHGRRAEGIHRHGRQHDQKNRETRLKQISQPSCSKSYKPHGHRSGSQDEPGLRWREMERREARGKHASAGLPPGID